MSEDPSERGSALLTPSQRERLVRGDGEGAADRATRKRIRERLTASVLDARLIADHLSTRDRDLVLQFGEGGEDDDLDAARDEARFRDGMVATLALLYEAHLVHPSWDFEATLARALDEAYSPTRGRVPHRRVTDLSFDVELAEPTHWGQHDVIKDKIVRGAPLSDAEVREVVKTGDLETIYALRDYLDERRKDESREQWLRTLDSGGDDTE